MTRGWFALSLAALVAAFLGAWHMADAALPALARVLNPQGINAGLVLNGLLLVLLAAFLLALALALAGRWRDAGASPWWSIVPVLGVIGWAVLGDWIFLWSRWIGAPKQAIWLCQGIAGLAIAYALLAPSRHPD